MGPWIQIDLPGAVAVAWLLLLLAVVSFQIPVVFSCFVVVVFVVVR